MARQRGRTRWCSSVPVRPTRPRTGWRPVSPRVRCRVQWRVTAAPQAWQTSIVPETITASAAGTWTLGDLTVNRLGFGAMRLPQRGPAFAPEAVPGDRAQAIKVLRRAVELGVNHIDTAAFYFSSLRSVNELINTALSPYPD